MSINAPISCSIVSYSLESESAITDEKLLHPLQWWFSTITITLPLTGSVNIIGWDNLCLHRKLRLLGQREITSFKRSDWAQRNVKGRQNVQTVYSGVPSGHWVGDPVIMKYLEHGKGENCDCLPFGTEWEEIFSVPSPLLEKQAFFRA